MDVFLPLAACIPQTPPPRPAPTVPLFQSFRGRWKHHLHRYAGRPLSVSRNCKARDLAYTVQSAGAITVTATQTTLTTVKCDGRADDYSERPHSVSRHDNNTSVFGIRKKSQTYNVLQHRRWNYKNETLIIRQNIYQCLLLLFSLTIHRKPNGLRLRNDAHLTP